MHKQVSENKRAKNNLGMKKLSFLIGSVFDQQGIEICVWVDNIIDWYGLRYDLVYQIMVA